MRKFKHSTVLFAGMVLVLLAGFAYAVPPQVIKTIPENGDQNVDISLRNIIIEFGQDMSQGGYSVCGSGPKYPETAGKANWTNKRTLAIPVKLQPNREYEFSVNCQSYRNFKNLQGQSAVIHPVKFKTSLTAKKSSLSKSPSLLLQEALYAEETEGDLSKAIKIYQQVIAQAGEIQRIAARATYQLGMCHLKKGEKEKAADYFQEVAAKYPTQKTLAKKAGEQLEKVGGRKVAEKNLFEILGNDVCSYLGSKYGEVCAEAGMKRMYSNSHIYFVDNDFILRSGGMGYVYNYTGLPITQKHRLGGTSYPNQILYDAVGSEMDVEILPDELRKNFYHIYWTPKEPLENGEFFNYGWAYDGNRKLSNFRGGTNYSLTMQNHLGTPGYDTFFLVVPQGITVADKSEEYTKIKNFGGYDIYWWKKEVQAETNHRVDVVLTKGDSKIADSHSVKQMSSVEVQNLINSARPGSTVTIPNGVYTFSMGITKPLTLKGQSRANCIFEVTENNPAIFIDTEEKGKVTLENITIKWQLATSDKTDQAFALGIKDSEAEIKNCSFMPLGNPERSPVAIRMIGFSNVTIDNCKFDGFGYPVFYNEGTRGTVKDCVIANCQSQGITLFKGANVDITGNIITGSRKHGIRCTGGILNVSDNLIVNNANRGIYLGNKSASGKINNNVILGNATGISGFARSKVVIENNIISDSSYAGISFRDSCVLQIRNNIFKSNQRGWIMFEEGNSNNNGCQRNTFWQNKTDVENFQKTGNSILENPKFTDAANGDFSLQPGSAHEHKQGLTNPQIFKTLWKRWKNPKEESEPIIKSSDQKATSMQTNKADKLASEDLSAEGWRLWGQRKLAEAEAKFKEAIAKNPDNENSYQGLGWAQLNQGKKLNAKDSFEKCIKLNP